MFTSGSTGEPKGVVITAGCLNSFLEWNLNEHPFEPNSETFLNQAPFSFDLSVMDLYPSLLTGGTLYSITKDEIANPRQLFQSLHHSQATTWVSTPSFAELCLSEPSFSAQLLPRLRRFLFCGETLPPEVAAELLNRFDQAEVWNTYGPTETTVAVTSVRIDREMLKRYSPLPVGYPKPDSLIRLARAEGSLAEENEKGEILISGASVSPGYLGRSDLTRKAFFDLEGSLTYRTGDVGHFQENLLFFDGRIDSQIKLHGYRIELGDVEANLRAVDGIQDAVVLAVIRRGRPDSLAAFVILSDRRDREDYSRTSGLRKALGQRLPNYMIPHRFHYLEAFPMTPNGKVDRRKLGETLA
jgi:D-alanine--poly(phosphoribitol) ligase subunit 1